MTETTFTQSEDGNEIHIRFPYDPDLVGAVKEISGRRFDADRKFWVVPMRPEALVGLRTFAVEAGVQLPASLVSKLNEMEAERQQNLELSRAKDGERLLMLPEDLGTALMPFQLAGVRFVMKNRRVILGDDMGLGKTLQSLAAVEGLGCWPCLIICPASLKYNWKREILRWLPHRAEHVLVVNGGRRRDGQRRGAHAVVINYELVGRNGWLWSVPWKAIIVDESHYIKNPKAKRTGFVLDLAKDCETVILNSGTPVLNKPIELTPQLSAIGRLDTVFGGFWAFVRRYCDAKRGQYGYIFDGATNLQELNLKLRQTCYIRREKREVLPELPEKRRTVLPVEITNRPEYNKARAELIAYIREQGRLSLKFLEALEDEIAQLPVEEDKEEYRQRRVKEYRMDKAQRAARAETLVKIETLKQVTARGKASAVSDWVQDFLQQSPDQKLVIFATHQDVIHNLRETLKEQMIVPLVLTGDTPSAERDRLVQVFQTDPLVRVFISNIQAGGVGITLTAASYVLFVEFAWNAATMDQAEDRLNRIGQKNAVNVYWMVGEDTLDEYLVDLIEEKRDITDQITNGGRDISQIADYLQKETE